MDSFNNNQKLQLKFETIFQRFKVTQQLNNPNFNLNKLNNIKKIYDYLILKEWLIAHGLNFSSSFNQKDKKNIRFLSFKDIIKLCQFSSISKVSALHSASLEVLNEDFPIPQRGTQYNEQCIEGEFYTLEHYPITRSDVEDWYQDLINPEGVFITNINQPIEEWDSILVLCENFNPRVNSELINSFLNYGQKKHLIINNFMLNFQKGVDYANCIHVQNIELYEQILNITRPGSFNRFNPELQPILLNQNMTMQDIITHIYIKN
jgi:hypothetical protein